MEADIRKGAMQMILFEELVYQQAERQKMTIPQARLDQALIDFRKQFPNQDAYDSFMKTEVGNSKQILLMRVRRSLLIDKMLKLNVTDKAAVSDVELRTYYDHNPERFRISDSLSLQTISLLPPPNATPEQLKALKTRAGDALAQAKKTTDYNGFGLLAEKISEDDYHVMMGDHQIVDKTKLPAEILKAAGSMKDGQVSDLISVGEAYCIVRLNAHVPAGMQKFDAVRVNLRKQLQQTKVEQLRSVLGKRLRAGAKVEEL
jgi:hypothetical protein